MKRMQPFLVYLACLVGSGAMAAETIRFESRPGSKVKIDGTSTMHDWTVESQIIKGTMEVPADFAKDPGAAVKNTKAEATIPVRSLKSGKTRMNEVMWEAMKMKDHPNIEYRLLELTPKTGGAQGKSAQFDARGTLKVAGVTRTNTIAVTIEKVDSTKAKVTGTINLKMTDFGIKPPSPIGIILTTGDDVKIAFEWQTEQATANAPKTAEVAK